MGGLRNRLGRVEGVRAHLATRTGFGDEVDSRRLLSPQIICNRSGANGGDGAGEKEQDAGCSGHYIIWRGYVKVENWINGLDVDLRIEYDLGTRGQRR